MQEMVTSDSSWLMPGWTGLQSLGFRLSSRLGFVAAELLVRLFTLLQKPRES